MQRSILALVSLIAFAVSSSAWAACAGHVASTSTKQTLASVEGGTTPAPVPTQSDEN